MSRLRVRLISCLLKARGSLQPEEAECVHGRHEQSVREAARGCRGVMETLSVQAFDLECKQKAGVLSEVR